MKSKSLKKLFKECVILSGNQIDDTVVSSIIYDSRKAGEGSLFVAIRGFSNDGHQYLGEAAARGAIAAVVETIDESISLPQYKVEDTRRALAHIAAEFYAPEINTITKIGITGTNGKTTTSYLVKSIMEAAAISCGLIGTIRYEVGAQKKQAWNTTPESSDLSQMLYQMCQQGQQSCVMEVSSHALTLHRVAGLQFDTAVFTNLTQDHLDFHQDMEAYFTAKKQLFDYLAPDGTAVLNSDDPFGKRLSEQLRCRKITYGFNREAQVGVLKFSSNLSGIDLTVRTPQGELTLKSSLIGKFNTENILAALAIGRSLNIDKNYLIRGIESLKCVPGRLESIKINSDRLAVVDYAHTPDALEKALMVLKEVVSGNLWVVFGCGGNRDKAKRPLMGRIAQNIADKVVVTSDNPRYEDPMEILEQIRNGMDKSSEVFFNADRREAIKYALENAGSGDLILVAGKGHEDYQEIAGVKYPFDDKKIILELTS
jgi:UDP-N-acetylmuramoyl-L-alanyl-D-glutamate--2,6-diaminopimelate ligase